MTVANITNTTKEVFKPVPTYAGIISILFIALPVAALDLILRGTNITHPVAQPLLFAILVIFLVMVVIAYGYFGMRYVINDEGVVIWWGILKRTVRFADITDAHISDKMKNMKGMRILGGEMPGYHFGLFRIKDLGKIHLYITNPKRIFVIETHKRKFGITPKNMDEFAKLVHARMQSTGEMGIGIGSIDTKT